MNSYMRQATITSVTSKRNEVGNPPLSRQATLVGTNRLPATDPVNKVSDILKSIIQK